MESTTLTAMSGLLWGIDLGGTKIEGVLLRLNESSPLEEVTRIRVPTEQEKGYSHILNQIATLVSKLSEAAGTNPQLIGFGTPGVLDPSTQLLKNSNTACLRNQPLQKDLENLLHCEIRLANDANCFALAESRFGAAQGASCVFGIIMGTGVGGGIVFEGRARYGYHGIAGEFGHISIDPTGPDCYCGKRGCVETYISGPALEASYTKTTTQKKSLRDIFSHLEEPAAVDLRNHLLEKFGSAVATMVNILDPDIIVVGGGVSNVDFLYTDGREAIARKVFNDTFQTPVVKNQLGDSAGVYGAACLCLE